MYGKLFALYYGRKPRLIQVSGFFNYYGTFLSQNRFFVD